MFNNCWSILVNTNSFLASDAFLFVNQFPKETICIEYMAMKTCVRYIQLQASMLIFDLLTSNDLIIKLFANSNLLIVSNT